MRHTANHQWTADASIPFKYELTAAVLALVALLAAAVWQ